MPILVALDECLTTLADISELAEQGLTDASKREAALLGILKSCEEVRQTVADIAESVPCDDPLDPSFH